MDYDWRIQPSPKHSLAYPSIPHFSLPYQSRPLLTPSKSLLAITSLRSSTILYSCQSYTTIPNSNTAHFALSQTPLPYPTYDFYLLQLLYQFKSTVTITSRLSDKNSLNCVLDRLSTSAERRPFSLVSNMLSEPSWQCPPRHPILRQSNVTVQQDLSYSKIVLQN